MNHLRYFVEIIFYISAGYFFLVNAIYLILLIAAGISIRSRERLNVLVELMKNRSPSFAPKISVIAPAYNEEASIVDSIKSFMLLRYPKFEVIVVNDGSKDKTLERLIAAFHLVLDSDLAPLEEKIAIAKVRGYYRSTIHPNLYVVDQENSGKASALNSGICFSKNELFCAVDSDSILEEDALLKMLAPFVESTKKVAAVGGIIRVTNGSTIKFSRVVETKMPKKIIEAIQIVEYIRAFLCGRVGWDFFGCTLVISGAFGVFDRKIVIDVGGYLHGSVGEDMELVVRIHKKLKETGEPYSVVFIPDPVCWTEVPSDWHSLGKQRMRWHRGLAEVLLGNWKMLFNPRYGAIGLFAFPYLFFVELFGPFIEILSILTLFLAFFLGLLNSTAVVLFLIVGLIYGIFMSVSAVLLEEIYFARYPKIRYVLYLILMSILENIGYRQINAYWRIKASFQYLKGDRSWGKPKRIGFGK